MPVVFNANEVYEIAVEIEKNGREFYKVASEKTENPEMKRFFSDLAQWEDLHVLLFESLKSQLADKDVEETVFDPDNEIHLYLKAAAGSHIFLKDLNIPSIIDNCKNPLDILKIAMQFEKDSVVLYNTMIGLVPESLGKSKIEKLTQEELKHVSIIYKKMEDLK